MNTLQAEQIRLYGAAPGSEPDVINLMNSARQVRAMVLELARTADWNALGTVWRSVQTDLELPAPAIAVNGVDGYQLWFSVAEPIALAEAQAFLEALRLHYLASVATARVSMWPATDASMPHGVCHARLAPGVQAITGHWSAFVAPDLASIFADEPWLDLTPSPEAQAGVLSAMQCIKPADFQRALSQMQQPEKTEASHATRVTVSASPTSGLQPRRFLFDVMNDPEVEMHLRIEAAKALLPYCKD